ncbi:hypothetical protein 7S11_3 [uncultured Caudovirales phage]|uniref:Head-to-tail stopper n=1 Tax=uncultured Caudovirales phage TaxID=2100421 RepID=A0A2H4J5S1_9CAUD|nr:hypothetical protein 7S11_3 [uncultured Caudovirales phage]
MLPALFTVSVKAFKADSEDELGNPIESWAPPVPLKVYGWSAPRSTEPKLAGHDRVVVDVELLAPEGFLVRPRDRVLLEGGEFEVIGYPEDYNHGPFGFRPGLVVNLQRVEG